MSPARRVRLTLALSLGAAFGILGAPATTLADCMMPAPIAEAVKTADIVFVGTVVETSNRNSWANVQVEDVWKGPDQPAVVVVKGGPPGNAATSVDRTFEVGVQYVFFPYVDGETQPLPGRAVELADNSCTNTTQWAAEHAALRPADARPPIGATATGEAGFDPMTLVIPAGVALLVAAVLLGIGLLARGRQTS